MPNKTTRGQDICDKKQLIFGFTPSCCLDIYSTLYFIYISLSQYIQLVVTPSFYALHQWCPTGVPRHTSVPQGSISSTFYAHIFHTKLLCAAFFYLHITREKLPKRLSYEKGVRKMLMKLTPGRY